MRYKLNVRDALQEFFIQSEISALQFSLATGIPESNVYCWLNGDYLPSFEYMIKIADYLNCSVVYLLGLSDDNSFQNTDDPSDFLTRIKILMAEKGCSKYDIAKNCGIGSSGVSKWFTKFKLPKIETLIVLSEYFDCSIDYLIGRSSIR